MANGETFEQRMMTLDLDSLERHVDSKGTIRPSLPSNGNISLDDAQQIRVAFEPAEKPAALHIGRTLGQGGMGVVYEAEQTSLRRLVAVKKLRRNDDVRGRVALLREALMTGRLQHPNIIPVHDVGKTSDGTPLIVMKVIGGTRWSDVLDDPESHVELFDGRDPLDFHLDVLCTVSNAIHYAHRQHTLHRDIKPDNVMIGEFGEVCVLDWGLAVLTRPIDGFPLPLARSIRSIAGTPSYMAPEMAAADGPSIGIHSDVYLLGATLHRIITGEPRHGSGSTLTVLEAAYRSSPAQWPKSTPPELASLCDAACHVDPTRRPASAAVFRKRLLEYRRHSRSSALLARGIERLCAVEDEIDSGIVGVQIERGLMEAHLFLSEGLSEWPDHKQGLRAIRKLDQMVALRARERRVLLQRQAASDHTVGEVARDRTARLSMLAAATICMALDVALMSAWLDQAALYQFALGGLVLYWIAKGLATWMVHDRAVHSPMSASIARAQDTGETVGTLIFVLGSIVGVPFGWAIAMWLATGGVALLVLAQITRIDVTWRAACLLFACLVAFIAPLHALLACAFGLIIATIPVSTRRTSDTHRAFQPA